MPEAGRGEQTRCPVYLMKRPSGGRGEYEIAETIGDVGPHDLAGRQLRVRVGRLGLLPTAIELREQGGKPRLRINTPGAVHIHRQVAAAVLLPKSIREEARLVSGFPVVFLNRYVLRTIHIAGLHVGVANADLDLGTLEADNASGTIQTLSFPDRVQRIERLQDEATERLPQPVAQAIASHRALLEGGSPLTSAAEESVEHLMSLVQAQAPAQGVEYQFGTDVLSALEGMAGVMPPLPPVPEPLPPTTAVPAGPVGEAYRPANEQAAVEEIDPFTIDPAIRERGLRGHATTQNALAEFVKGRGLNPRSPKPGEPNFDLAWEDGDPIFVAEVKSMTFSNEEKQLRLGLGQVLRYRQVLGKHGREVVAVLAVEKRPEDHSWEKLCEALGVVLVWPENMAEALGASPPRAPAFRAAPSEWAPSRGSAPPATPRR